MSYQKQIKKLWVLLVVCLAFQFTIPALAAEETGKESTEDITGTEESELPEDVIPPDESGNDGEAPAEEVKHVRVSSFAIPEAYKASYDAVYKVSSEHLTNVSNNGGKYAGSVLANLTDGNLNTHWETGRANNSNFKNTVTFTFDDIIELGSMVYYPRVQGAANKGFPTAFSIYASAQASGEDFTLVFSEKASIVSGGTQISFDQPTQFRRLRFVFDEANQNWAAAAEMAFYLPDPLIDEVNDLFADGTMSSLKPKYQDEALLNGMLERAKIHPNQLLAEKVQTAINILNKTVDYASQVQVIEQRGNGVNHARKILKTSSYASNFLPTGWAARPGDIIKVYVQVDDGAPMPTLVFTQQIGRFGYWQKKYQLKNGENIFTAPRIYSDSWSTKTNPGGAIYIENPYTAKDQGTAPKIRIEGAIDYPLFRDGDDEEAFLKELKAYRDEMNANPDTTIDIVELYSDWFILNGNLRSAKAFLDSGRSPQATVNLHNSRVQEMLAFAGIDESSFIHSRNGARLNMRLMQPYGAGYAASDHVGIQQGSANTFFYGEQVGWIYTHETGHQLDMVGGKVPEVTNNMWANHIAVDVQNEYDRVQYGGIFQKVGRDDYMETGIDGVHTLGMWWQLQMLDENYWPDYQKAFRMGIADNMGLTDRQRMAVVSSYVLGMDVTEHFERYRFITPDEKIDAALEALDIPAAPENVKPWYMWTKAGKDRKSAFADNYTPEILSVTRVDGKLKITMSIDQAADQALLGYEVMQDGKIIGFTNNRTFSTELFTDDQAEHAYTVRAYDLRSNQSEVSEPYMINLDAPVFKVTGNTLTPLYEEFEPADAVSAYDRNGADISSSIRILSSEVNTSVRGTYTVVYGVTDAYGLSAQIEVPVTVVSTFDYLSDLQEESAKVGYGTLKKDQSVNGRTITLLKNQTPVTFAKGLGAHASSSVVYNVEGKGYRYFESFIGINQSEKNAKPNAIFRVFVDGEKRFDSGEMKVTDNMGYVLVDIQGAGKVELVTDSNGTNASDHTVWANARFSSDNRVPAISAEDVSFRDPADVNIETIVAQATAQDVEDGDLTDAITYTTNYKEGKTGNFQITYQVTDSDGNTVSFVQNIAVVNSFVYVSDTDWKSAKVGWGSIKKDRSLSGNAIKLPAESGSQTYEKGLGIHAYSEVVYDVNGKGYHYFESEVGVDATAGNNNSSVVFQVYVDGVLQAETPLMRRNTPAQHISVSLEGAKQLKLVVTTANNGNANDHANWADAKFLTAVQEADKDDLNAVVEQARSLDEAVYTEETWADLAAALSDAETILNNASASQEETDTALHNLTQAVDNLKYIIETKELEDILAFARAAADLNHVDPALKHAEERLANLQEFIHKAEDALSHPEVTQEEIDYYIRVLPYFIDDIGQTYEEGQEPVVFVQDAQ